MAEYIEREKAIKTVKFYDGYNDPIPWAVDSLKVIPAADVRPVVICENCKHCLKLDEHESWCKVHSPIHLVRPDDWCSRGEERDNG